MSTLLVHGAKDTLVWVRQSQRYAERLEGAGARHFYLELPWATHGFEFNRNGPGGQLALYALEQFLARELDGISFFREAAFPAFSSGPRFLFVL